MFMKPWGRSLKRSTLMLTPSFLALSDHMRPSSLKGSTSAEANLVLGNYWRMESGVMIGEARKLVIGLVKPWRKWYW